VQELLAAQRHSLEQHRQAMLDGMGEVAALSALTDGQASLEEGAATLQATLSEQAAGLAAAAQAARAGNAADAHCRALDETAASVAAGLSVAGRGLEAGAQLAEEQCGQLEALVQAQRAAEAKLSQRVMGGVQQLLAQALTAMGQTFDGRLGQLQASQRSAAAQRTQTGSELKALAAGASLSFGGLRTEAEGWGASNESVVRAVEEMGQLAGSAASELDETLGRAKTHAEAAAEVVSAWGASDAQAGQAIGACITEGLGAVGAALDGSVGELRGRLEQAEGETKAWAQHGDGLRQTLETVQSTAEQAATKLRGTAARHAQHAGDACARAVSAAVAAREVRAQVAALDGGMGQGQAQAADLASQLEHRRADLPPADAATAAVASDSTGSEPAASEAAGTPSAAALGADEEEGMEQASGRSAETASAGGNPYAPAKTSTKATRRGKAIKGKPSQTASGQRKFGRSIGNTVG
jgi:hypothetical protein